MNKLVTPTPEPEAIETAFVTPTGKCPRCLKEGNIGQNCPDHSIAYTHQWADLNDVFEPGDLEVWYLRRECTRTHGSFGDNPDPKNLEATHILVGKIAASTNGSHWIPANELDNVWVKLQGESWSPNGEANEFVRGLGVHTSMSVGDCFRLNGEVHRVVMCGFEVVR